MSAEHAEHLVMPKGHMDDLYRSNNPLVRYVHTKRIKNAASLVPVNACRVLDVGCGEGQLLELLSRVPARQLFGVDVLPHVVAQARARLPAANIMEASGSRLRFETDFFDAVTCIDVLEHVPNWRAVVREVSRVVRPGGTIVLGWPNDDNWNFARMLLGKGPVPDHINILTPRIVRQAIGRLPLRSRRIPAWLPWKFCLTVQECYKK